jgi:phosphoribosylanthranilate isomerase
MKVKICGMRSAENIKEVLKYKPDYLGFIFYEKSKRFVDELALQEITNIDFGATKKVGVFVNAAADEILAIHKKFQLDVAQLHGDESPNLLEQLKSESFKLIKVFSVGDDFNAEQLNEFSMADYFLFDTKGLYRGGNGVKFDWSLLSGINFSKPIFLSGGLSVNDVDLAKKSNIKELFALDLNSGLEDAPSVKNVKKVKKLMQKI